ncbi:MAG: cellulase family glycosylhydrolase [Bacteroidales bacterium]|nr:cellulase family glycosylhydrolase [Bacteroidales bacterium]
MIRMIIISTVLILLSQSSFSQAPFSRGVNLTNWFQTGSAQQIQFSKFTEQDFIDIKSLGCDVIRLPINLHFMTDGAPDYTLNPLFLTFLDQAVEWAEEQEIHLLLDNHTFDPSEDTDPNIGDILLKVWPQMAQHYKDQYENLYYEVLNEPHGIGDALWGQIQQEVIDTIRTIDSTHTIIVGPAGWNGYNNLKYMPVYSDTNLIYTFHFYDPFLFTHQGASWTDPSMGPLAGVPFPYHADSMPVFPESLKGTWIESSFNGYQFDGTLAKVKSLINIAVTFQETHNVPIYCGEFGVYIPNSDPDDRVYWYQEVVKYLEEKNIMWTMWDYTGGFGIFDGGNQFESDLNVPLVEAMGLTAPEQVENIVKPDSTGFYIYKDYIGEKIRDDSWMSAGQTSFYDEHARFGEYSIYWTGVDQYNRIGFLFNPVKDLSKLLENDYGMHFWIKGNDATAAFHIRFLDTKTDDPDDHPWRMHYNVTNSVVPFDNAWHEVFIPLSSFTEQGSWDIDTWYNPAGKFDWAKVQTFEIVAEHYSLTGIEFWFDNIGIVDILSSVGQNNLLMKYDTQITSYPNPSREGTTISYFVQKPGPAEISMYDLSGKKIRTLVDGFTSAGLHTITGD